MLKILEKIFPIWINNQLFKVIKSVVINFNKNQSSKIPIYKINSENIKNTRLVIDREELLKLLPKKGILAELGVDEGNFSELILKTCNPNKLYLIDFWGSKRYNQNKKKDVENKFKTFIDNGKVEINLGLSTEVVKEFRDNYFDWIYIDTDHTYETTIKELEVWKSKVKENGIIAGHDYIVGNWDGWVRYGVIEAVYEFCSKYNWEILYLTMEIHNKPSFAIKKIINQ